MYAIIQEGVGSVGCWTEVIGKASGLSFVLDKTTTNYHLNFDCALPRD